MGQAGAGESRTAPSASLPSDPAHANTASQSQCERQTEHVRVRVKRTKKKKTEREKERKKERKKERNGRVAGDPLGVPFDFIGLNVRLCGEPLQRAAHINRTRERM